MSTVSSASRVANSARRLLLAVLCALPLAAFAQGYPNKPIRVVSPWPPGGPADGLARPIFERMSEVLGQPMVILNRPGANGEVGTASVAAAEPDGYTVLFASTGPNVMSLAMQRNVKYEAIGSFEPITIFADSPSVIVVRASLPVRNLQELVEHAKRNPGTLTYASAGAGSAPQISLESLKRAAGIDIREIPYPGMAAATVDVLADRVDVMSAQFGNLLPHIQAGKLRAMGVATGKRSLLMPEVPTVAEVIPAYIPTNSWYGLMVPKGTPKEVVDKLYAASVTALRTPALEQKLKTLGLDIALPTPAAFTEDLKKGLETWTRQMKVLGMVK